MSGQWAAVPAGATWRVAMELPDGTQLLVTTNVYGHSRPRAYQTIEFAVIVADALNQSDDFSAAPTADISEFQARVAAYADVVRDKESCAFHNRGSVPRVCLECGLDFMARRRQGRGKYCSFECAQKALQSAVKGLWTQSDRARLESMWRTMTNREIGVALGRSTRAIEAELGRMGIRRPVEFYLSRPNLAHLVPQAYPRELKEVIALQKQVARRLDELAE